MHITDAHSTQKSLQSTTLTPDTKNRPSISFGDVLDSVNPLQHIPVVSSLYRSVTGDEISQSARLVGDSLYGGVIGATSAVINILTENITGKDITENVVASLTETAHNSQYQDLGATPLTANNDINIELSTSSATSSTTKQQAKEMNKSFFELTKEAKLVEVNNLGLDNEGLRTQLMGQLDETFYKKL